MQWFADLSIFYSNYFQALVSTTHRRSINVHSIIAIAKDLQSQSAVLCNRLGPVYFSISSTGNLSFPITHLKGFGIYAVPVSLNGDEINFSPGFLNPHAASIIDEHSLVGISRIQSTFLAQTFV